MISLEINKQARLSEHFTLGELVKTKYKTEDGNIPSHVVIENLKRICENWLEELRFRYNERYASQEEPIVINSGYRSPEVNRLAGGAQNSNHLTGCAVDIRCAGKEQMIRYASILLDIADGTKQDYDELLLEQHGSVCWLHFAVRPSGNRRRIGFIKA